MRNPFPLLTIFLLFSGLCFGQKLKKADKAIVSNIQTHLVFLGDAKLEGRKTGSAGELAADDYIQQQLEKQNVRPKAEHASWFQQFRVYDGREVLPGSFLMINGKHLKLFNEFFPFCFSANKKAEASVAMALSENGVPWFADLEDLSEENNNSSSSDPLQLIRLRAGQAAAKGATALIVFNKSDSGQLEYHPKSEGPSTSIPVLYVTKSVLLKYLSDESANLDIKLNVELKEKNRVGNNVIGYLDNKADSTVLITAHLDDENDVAALLEIARQLKNSRHPANNYLFVVFSGEEKGLTGAAYFNAHLPDVHHRVRQTIHLDTVRTIPDGPGGLAKVKSTLSIVEKANKNSRTNRKA